MFDDLGSVLRADLLHAGAVQELKRRLRAGAPCIVRDAFREDFAEALHRRLVATEGWQPQVHFDRFGAYHTHMIEAARLPDELRGLERIFAADRSRELIADWSGADCHRANDFNAAHYRPGDYSLPHNDHGDGRTVSYICHFSKEWDPKWGGHFCWCSPTATVSPTFNSLVLFRVTPQSYHFVTPVVPHAGSARLTMHGWYLGRDQPTDEQPKRTTWARGPVDEIGAGLFAIGG